MMKTKTKKSTKSLALVLAAVLALTPMAGFPLTALATGDTAAPKAEAPAGDADAPAADAADTPQPDAPATDADANTDATPGTPAADASETPQAEAPATDAATNLDIAGSVTNPLATNAVTPGPTDTPTTAPDAATGIAIDATNFPDEKFRAYVQRNFDKEKDGKKDGILDTDEIKAAKSIYVMTQGITTLKGLEHFTALTSLSCYYNPLTTLDISANTALTSLQCFGDSLTTLDLSHNPALVYLDCGGNNLTTLDVSKNTALDTLRCENNKLTTLNLAGLNKLSEISWCTNFSPQAPQIPVVKRGTQHQLDIEALAKGQTLTAITLDGVAVDLETYEKMRDTAPKDLQYTCETGALRTSAQTMEVKATCVLYHPATLVTDANGTLAFDGTSPMANELVLRDGSNPAFTITPKPGYRVATLTKNGEDVKGSLVGETLTLPAVTDAVTIAVTFEEIPTPPVDPVDPPNPPVDPVDPINPPTPPVVPDNGGNGNGNNNGGNGNGATTVVERTNTVTVPAAPQAAALAAPETPATLAAPATAAAKTEAAPAKATADTAAPQGQLENPALGAQALDTQHSHLPLALLLLAVWLVGGFVVIRQRKHTHDAIDGASY